MEINGIITGLGNPGAEYENTRHNFGFMVIDALEDLCARSGSLRTISSKKDPFILSRGSFSGPLASPAAPEGEWLFLKPMTYMNRSGEAVRQVSSFYRIPADKILVIHDELDLPPGRMKLKKGGGNAGHNGLKSIQQCLGTADFIRLRMGIGKPEHQEVYSYVLSKFPKADSKIIETTIDGATEGILLLLREGETAAQQFCNSFKV